MESGPPKTTYGAVAEYRRYGGRCCDKGMSFRTDGFAKGQNRSNLAMTRKGNIGYNIMQANPARPFP